MVVCLEAEEVVCLLKAGVVDWESVVINEGTDVSLKMRHLASFLVFCFFERWRRFSCEVPPLGLVNSMLVLFSTVLIENCVHGAFKATTKKFHGHFDPAIPRQ